MRVHFRLASLKTTSWTDYGVRFVFGGAISVIAGYLAKEYGPTFGGLFLAFPAIFPATSTLIEFSEREQKERKGKSGYMRGRRVAAVNARGGIWGSAALLCFAAFGWKLLPRWNAAGILLAALCLWVLASIIFWRSGRWIRRRLRRRTHATA